MATKMLQRCLDGCNIVTARSPKVSNGKDPWNVFLLGDKGRLDGNALTTHKVEPPMCTILGSYVYLELRLILKSGEICNQFSKEDKKVRDHL